MFQHAPLGDLVARKQKHPYLQNEDESVNKILFKILSKAKNFIFVFSNGREKEFKFFQKYFYEFFVSYNLF